MRQLEQQMLLQQFQLQQQQEQIQAALQSVNKPSDKNAKVKKDTCNLSVI